MELSGHPPLGDAARRALEVIPEGGAVHLAVVSVVCNSLHRHGGAVRAADCARCRHAGECRLQVDAAMVYVGNLTARARSSTD